MASDKYRWLAIECDDLPDDSLLLVLSGAIALQLGDTTRTIMARIGNAPSMLTPAIYAANFDKLIAYRKGTLDVRADILEPDEFTITLTGTGAATAVVSLLPPADWPIDTPFGRTKANAFGGNLTAVGGVVKVPLANPGMGQVVKIVVQGSTFLWYGYAVADLQPGGSVTIPLSFPRDTPFCGGGLAVEIPVGLSVDVFLSDIIISPVPLNGWVGVFASGGSTLLGDMKARNTGGTLTPVGTKVTFGCADIGAVLYDEWHWNDGWQGDWCTSVISVQDNGGNCP